VSHISEVIPRILRDDSVFNDFLRAMSITVTEMFRDPSFYVAVREKVLPYSVRGLLSRPKHGGSEAVSGHP